MKDQLNRTTVSDIPQYPIRAVQFGEGNFLRAFVDYAIQVLNTEEGFGAGVAVVQPIEHGMVRVLQEQNGLYTLFSNGITDGVEIQEETLITVVERSVDPYRHFDDFLSLAREPELRFIFSNTTESGIAFDPDDKPTMTPPGSFPAKLTLLLYERYLSYDGAPDKGVAIIPCELINHNADTLRALVLDYAVQWQLDNGFTAWLEKHNSFHNTLVDRIVPGYPKDDLKTYADRLPYTDKLMVTSEIFFLWVIEDDGRLAGKLPFSRTGLDVKFVLDMQPYRTRKVRILNGAHTAMVPTGLLYGCTTVKEAVEDPFMGDFIKEAVFEEIIPTLSLDRNELEDFAIAVLDRFRNPFIRHQLASIALNSFSKFKVRVLPSLLAYTNQNGKLPPRLTFAFACLLRFYKGDWQGTALPVQDDAGIVGRMQNLWDDGDAMELLSDILSDTALWGLDLTTVPGLMEALHLALTQLDRHGVADGFERFIHS